MYKIFLWGLKYTQQAEILLGGSAKGHRWFPVGTKEASGAAPPLFWEPPLLLDSRILASGTRRAYL